MWFKGSNGPTRVFWEKTAMSSLPLPLLAFVFFFWSPEVTASKSQSCFFRINLHVSNYWAFTATSLYFCFDTTGLPLWRNLGPFHRFLQPLQSLSSYTQMCSIPASSQNHRNRSLIRSIFRIHIIVTMKYITIIFPFLPYFLFSLDLITASYVCFLSSLCAYYWPIPKLSSNYLNIFSKYSAQRRYSTASSPIFLETSFLEYPQGPHHHHHPPNCGLVVFSDWCTAVILGYPLTIILEVAFIPLSWCPVFLAL